MAAISPDKSSLRIPVPHWSSPRHPVYSLETRRRVQNPVVTALQLGCVPAIFGATALALAGIIWAIGFAQLLFMSSWYDFEYMLPTILIWAGATMFLIQLAAGAMANILVIAQTSPMISGEVELQSWGLLRTTTLSLREIFFAKYAAALTQFRTVLFGLMGLRLASTITLLLVVGYSTFRDTFIYRPRNEWMGLILDLHWIPAALGITALTATYISQPVIQLLLNTGIGMLASAYARARGQALVAGLVGRLGLWVTAALVNGAALAWLNHLMSQWRYPTSAMNAAYYGAPYPSPTVDLWSTWLTTGGYAIAVLAAQIGLIALALGIALRRTRSLGV